MNLDIHAHMHIYMDIFRYTSEIIFVCFLLQEVTSSGKSSVTFDELLKLYINHRPVMGVSKAQIAKAFEALGATGAGKKRHI